jgi:O-acetyl-ADP-ribose deacetylase (regulator of RNase III)
MRIEWNNFEKDHGRLYFEKADGAKVDNQGIRAYSSIIGKIMNLFRKADKLEIDRGEGVRPEVFYVNHRSLISWLARNKTVEILPGKNLEDFVNACLAPHKVESDQINERSFHVRVGDLVEPQEFKNKSGGIATVNAANPEMEHGRGGLNAAFSKVIPQEQWNAARDKAQIVGDGFGDKAVPGHLRTGQAAQGPDLDNGMMLIHALGPDLNKVEMNEKNYDQLVNGPGGLKAQVQAAYSSAFKVADDNGYVNVQVPEISGGIFANRLSSKLKQRWLKDIGEALRAAIRELPSESKIQEVILVKLK